MAKVSVRFVGDAWKPTDRVAAQLDKAATFRDQIDAVLAALKIDASTLSEYTMHKVVEDAGKKKPGPVITMTDKVEVLDGSHWVWLKKATAAPPAAVGAKKTGSASSPPPPPPRPAAAKKVVPAIAPTADGDGGGESAAPPPPPPPKRQPASPLAQPATDPVPPPPPRPVAAKTIAPAVAPPADNDGSDRRRRRHLHLVQPQPRRWFQQPRRLRTVTEVVNLPHRRRRHLHQSDNRQPLSCSP
jgi:hypothetical protein